MSEGQVIGAAATARDTQVRSAIARAADATGIDFNYLLAQARLESSLDPGARAPTSSAAGLYQFTQGTWLETLGRHGEEHGLAWVSNAIRSGLSDPGLRNQVMGLRYDASTSAMMAAELAGDNRAELSAHLGREPDATELYLAHFLGSAGARTFLSANEQNPGQSAVALLPKAAQANRSIFYAGGAPRSVGAVMALMRGKVSAAMEGAGQAGFTASPRIAYENVSDQGAFARGPIAQEFHAARPAMPAPVRRGGLTAPALPTAPASRPSMAETLRGTFGASEDAMPGHVRNAYARLARFGL